MVQRPQWGLGHIWDYGTHMPPPMLARISPRLPARARLWSDCRGGISRLADTALTPA